MTTTPELHATLPCHWYENPDHPGERFLVPCCHERVQDPDAECTCELPIDELARLRQEAADLRTRLARAELLHQCLHSAVLGTPDADRIYQTADDLIRARMTPGGTL